MMNEFKLYVVSSTTPVVIAAAGRNAKIHSVSFPKATVGTVTFADQATSPASQIVYPAATVGQCDILDVVIANGLTVTNASASDYVIVSAVQY